MTKSKRKYFWISILALIGISIYVIIKINSASPGPIPLPDQISDSDWTKGNPEAKIVLIEYSDFECPYCVVYYEMVEEVMKEFENHVRFAYRHFPLNSIHQHAQYAAQATEAAGLQGKFWEMYKVIFDNQEEWAVLSTKEVEEKFIDYANEINLDITQFVEDIDSTAVINEVEKDAESALNAGLTGTPSFFLDGVKIDNPRTLEDFRLLIRQEIEKNS